MTRKEFYEVVKAAHPDDAEIVEICDKELASMVKKADSDKKRRAEKSAQGDELSATILSLLTENPQTISEIMEGLGGETEDITSNKVAYRCSKLAAAGDAAKFEVTFELPPDGRKTKRVAYAIAAKDAE